MADLLAIRDGGGASRNIFFKDAGGSLYIPAHTLVDSAGADLALLGRAVLVPAASFTRPANTTPYASGDCVANSVTAGSVTPMPFTAARVAAYGGRIVRARLSKTGVSVTNAQFRLHLYNASPTVANGDNDAFSTTGAGATPTHIGSVDITMAQAFSDGAWGAGAPADGGQIDFKLASGTTLYGLLEARAAYTPGSEEQFSVTLEVETT